MSRCISRHGEYSEHELSDEADPYFCMRCFTTDEDAIMAALRSAEAERDRLAARVARVEALVDAAEASRKTPLTQALRAALAEEPPDA